MRRNREGHVEDLAELVDGWAVEPAQPCDAALAPLVRLAAELRDQAIAPPSPRRAALRAELIAKRDAHRHRGPAMVAIVAGALMTLTAVVAVVALPAAAPVRDAVQSLLGTWMQPASTPGPTATPSEDSDGRPSPPPSMPAPITSAPVEISGGAAATLEPSASEAASPAPSDGTTPTTRPQASPPQRPSPSSFVPPSPPRPTPYPTGPPWPEPPTPAVTVPPLP